MNLQLIINMISSQAYNPVRFDNRPLKFKYMKRLIQILLFITSVTTANSQSTIKSDNHRSDYYSQSINSSPEEIKFEKIPSDQGLSHSYIRSMIQDSYGFMWFGTAEGLNRFDGFTFKSYKNIVNDKYSIPDNHVVKLFQDKEKTLWIGTKTGDIAKYDRDNDRFITVSNEETVPSTSTAGAFLEDKNGDLLIGFMRAGIKIFKKRENIFIEYFEPKSLYDSLFPLNSVGSMLFIDENRLLFGSGNEGLGLYNNVNKKLKKFVHDSLNDKSISSNAVTCIFKDSHNRIFIGTQNGLNIYNIDEHTFTSYKNNPADSKSISYNYVLSICEDKNNNIWIGTGKGGLNKFNNDGTFLNYKFDISDPSNIFNVDVTVYVDKSNVLWIGTRGGISKLDCERKKFHTLSKAISTPENSYDVTTSSIFIDSTGLIRIGVRFCGGLFNFRKDVNGFLKLEEYSYISKLISTSTITGIISDSNSNLWFTDFLGGHLVKYEKLKNNYVIYNFLTPKRATSLCLLNNHILISLEDWGILNFDIDKQEFKNPVSSYPALGKLPRDDINYLFLDKKNILWIASKSNGLFEYEFNTDILNNYRNNRENPNSISSNEVRVIKEDSKHSLWIATGAGGIDRFDQSKNIFTRYNFGDKLTSVIIGILEDNNGFLWFCSNDGLYKFDPVKQTARHYDTKDGTLSYNFGRGACSRDKEGMLYFGGSTGGLTYFNPNEIKDNPYIPNIVITDFQIFNQSVKPSPENPYLKKSITVTKEINLSYKESVFSFDFAALIFNNPSKNQYAYIMEGFDKDWVYCGTKRNATYTNLDPGDYTFRVKGSNNDGIWNEEGTSIKITISPPWYQTWWFKSCGAALIFMTAGYGFRKRINNLKREKLAQEEFSKKLINSQEEERKKIASVLHDSIAHDVLITKNTSELGLRIAGENEEVKEILNKISGQSSSTLDELRRVQFNLHPYEVEKLGLTKAIKSIIDRVSKSSEIEFTIEEDFIDKVFSEENEIHLYRIIQEAINNIIKHSSATKSEIKIIRNDDRITITISDNGKGFSKRYALRKNSMGLSGITERVKLLRGNLEIESESGIGTVLKISLPVD